MISQKKKKLLCEFQNHTCELCHKEKLIGELHIHRIRRGCSYEQHRSLQVLCLPCHSTIHGREYPHVSRSY